MPNVVVVYLFGENFSELADICRPTIINYCAKNGYDCNIKCVNKNKKGWYGFINTKHGRELLERYDLVFMMEGDFLITNPNIKIENLIDDQHSFFICKDRNHINGGSWVAKGNKDGKDFLDFINRFEDECEHEQTPFELWCESDYRVKVLDHPSINSIKYDEYYPSYGKIGYKDGEVVEMPTVAQGNWTPKSLNCHLPGRSLSDRIKIFTEIKAQLSL